MSSQKTANLKLHKWVKSDPIKMTEFNENFQKIDAAIAAGAKIATGSYVGTGTYGSSNPCSLTFDFPPQIVFITQSDSWYGDFFIHGAQKSTMLPSSNFSYYGYNVVEWNNNSIKWYAEGSRQSFESVQMNKSGSVYKYVVIG